MRSLREELWLHNIYFRRHGPPHATADSFTQLLAEGNRSIWLTNCIVQGDGSDDPVLGGLSVYGAQVYAKGTDLAFQPSSRIMLHMPAVFLCFLHASNIFT